MPSNLAKIGTLFNMTFSAPEAGSAASGAAWLQCAAALNTFPTLRS
jgi:hypothetical protein